MRIPRLSGLARYRDRIVQLSQKLSPEFTGRNLSFRAEQSGWPESAFVRIRSGKRRRLAGRKSDGS
jgi:hypothetical protein